jgi:hypothetical protein
MLRNISKCCHSVLIMVVLCCVVLFGQSTFAAVRIIRVDGASGLATPSSPGGNSWTNDYLYLQDALTEANAHLVVNPADTVELWVRGSTSGITYKPDQGSGYTSGNRAHSFQLLEKSKLFGGFSGNETVVTQRKPAVNITILSGNIGSAGSETDNSLQVVTATDLDIIPDITEIDGFTIREGYGVGSGSLADALGGAGISLRWGQPANR